MFLVPESPAYLTSVGKEEEAIKSLEWLRGTGKEEIRPEVEELKKATKVLVK